MRQRRTSRFFNGLLITLCNLEVIHHSHCYAITRLCVHMIRHYYNATHIGKGIRICEIKALNALEELKIEIPIT